MKFNVARDMFVPKKFAKKIEFKDVAAVVYIIEPTLAKAFAGKKAKSVWFYRFQTPDQLKAHVDDWAKGLRREAAERAKHAADKVKPNELKVGDILYDSWGWEQTNIDWYEVVAVKGQFVELKQLEANVVESGHLMMQGKSTPKIGKYRLTLNKEEVIRRKVVYGNAVKTNGHGWCSKWDGTPKSCSWYA